MGKLEFIIETFPLQFYFSAPVDDTRDMTLQHESSVNTSVFVSARASYINGQTFQTDAHTIFGHLQ